MWDNVAQDITPKSELLSGVHQSWNTTKLQAAGHRRSDLERTESIRSKYGRRTGHGGKISFGEDGK